MKTRTMYIAAVLLMIATTLPAQSTSGQTKPKSGQQQGAATSKSSKQSQGSGSASAMSEATTGTPPTHLDKSNKVPTASNPQNTGVNAANKQKSAAASRGGQQKDTTAAGKSSRSSGQQSQGKKQQP